MFWLAFAAQITAPQPIKYLSWFSNDDMPQYVRVAGIPRRVLVRAVVRPDGSLQACEVESGSGDEKLDLFTCGLVVKRAKYSPARWSDGSTVYGVDRVPVIWAARGPLPPEFFRGDLELTVERLPNGIRAPAFVSVAIATDASGQWSACAAAPPRGRTTSDNAQLVQIACEQLKMNYTPIPAKDDAGHLRSTVQNVSVRFDRNKRS
jgi:hypothetical protein